MHCGGVKATGVCAHSLRRTTLGWQTCMASQ